MTTLWLPAVPLSDALLTWLPPAAFAHTIASRLGVLVAGFGVFFGLLILTVLAGQTSASRNERHALGIVGWLLLVGGCLASGGLYTAVPFGVFFVVWCFVQTCRGAWLLVRLGDKTWA